MNDTHSDAPAADAATTLTITLDPENPWLGLESYTEATRAYFHGRDEEAGELSRRVQHANLTVLFGQSGLGKTSLLRAGVVPRLRKVGFCPVYVRIDYAQGSPTAAEQIKRAVFQVTLAAGHWTRPGAAIQGESLWEFLHHRGDLLRDAEGHPLTPLLIFDQFEEIFTLGQADDAGKARAQQFLDDLADLVENRAPAALEARMDQDDAAAEDFDFARADYRVLIALREDYLAHLESLKGTMPSITQNRMRLARMTGAQALSAVVKPGGKLVTAEVAEAIARFVAGGSELANAEIEPSLLSLVCRELNTLRQSQHRNEISTDLLAGSRDTILSEFYERALADQPEGVRRVIEDELLTESGYRESLAEERVQKALAEAGAAPDALATLVNRRLLRIEDRLDLRRVELTHDVLCGVVRASREQRHAREAQDAAERQLAEQRAREAATHRTLVRTRMIAIGCAVLFVLAIIAAAFGFVGMHRATTAEAQATAARTNAEGLVGFMTGDLYTELAPTGQSALLGKLAQRTVDYYAKLPASQLTPQTELNRGMALVRLAQSQNAASNYPAATRNLREAEALFRKLRAAGHGSDAVTYGLALALYQQGFAVVEDSASGNGQIPLQKAADLLRPLATGPHASREARQLYADDLNQLSAFQAPAKAVATEEAASKLLASLGALNLSDLDAAASWADASSNEALQLLTLGRSAQAQQLAQKVAAVADQVLAKQPGNLHAMADRFAALDTLGTAAEFQHDGAAAAGYATRETKAAEQLARFDPSNVRAWEDWMEGLGHIAYLQFERGDVRGSLATQLAAVALAHKPHSPAGLAGFIPSYLAPLAQLQAQTGDPTVARQTMNTFAHYARAGLSSFAGDDPMFQLVNFSDTWLEPRLQLIGGKPQAAFSTATAAIAKLRGIKVPADDLDTAGIKTWVLDVNLSAASAAALKTGRYPQAEALARQRLEVLHAYITNPANATVGYGFAVAPNAPLEIPRAEANLAEALAMQGKKDAAVKALAPALAYYAAQQKTGAHGTTFRHDYAYALYVKSLTAPVGAAGAKQRKADLAEAAQLIAGASQQAQQLSQFRYLSSLIK